MPCVVQSNTNCLKMGYLSQKKHKLKENIFLIISATVLSLITVFYVVTKGLYFELFSIFHVYCLSMTFTVYTIFVKRYKFALIYGVIILVNYILISANANIFFSKTFDGQHKLKLPFSKEQTLKQGFNSESLFSSGTLVLANTYVVPYINVDQGNILTLIKVDFQNATKAEYGVIFRQLKDFIINLDTPVIVFGNFGIPSWDRLFIKFLRESKLKVKNRFIFTGNSFIRFIKNPGFYVLGFEEMGVNNIETKSNGDIDTTVSFNSEAF